MRECSTAIVGAGAAGLVAAISAKQSGTSCVVCDRLPKIGKKILASGNGRCNLSNIDLSASNYNTASRGLVSSVFGRFGPKEIDGFFRELGLELVCEDGRVFPATNQSSSVLKVLELELGRLAIPVETDFPVARIEPSGNGFSVASAKGDKRIKCSSVIIAGGGRSYPALGSDGSAHKLAESLGHNIIEPVPSAVPLTVKSELCHAAQGQRIDARLRAVISGKVISESRGDLLFTKYGISGTAVLDISREISIAMNRDKSTDVYVSADIVPFMGEGALERNIENSIKSGKPKEYLLSGVLPLKISAVMGRSLAGSSPLKMAAALKSIRLAVAGTRGWNEADFTAGGVSLDEIDPVTLGSRIRKGVYFAGEVLDVDGRRGGYNLAWAWASGYVAGKAV